MTSLTKNKSIENTIEPDYDGHDVDDLLKEKRADIEKLKDLLGADMPEPDAKVFPYYDDIFYLRYILSFSTAEDSVEPIKAAIEYRHNNPKFADMLKKVEEETWEFEPIVETSLKYQVAGLSDAKLDHGPLVIIRPGKSHSSLQFDALTFEEMKMLHFAYREIAFRQCDKHTRSSRKIVKQLLIMDLTDVSISELSDRRGEKIFIPVAKASANYYPQMQHKFVMVNAPGWISAIFGLMKRVMPARNFSKLGLCQSKLKTTDGDISKCPFASRYLDASLLPSFLGGTLEDKDLHYSLTGEKLCPEARKDGNSNSGGRGDVFEKVLVSRRAKKVVEYLVPSKNIVINWKILVAAYGIKMTAVLMEQTADAAKLIDKSQLENGVSESTGNVLQVFHEASKEEKIKAENGLLKGVWKPKAAGILRITFDNSYSILRPKTIKYAIQLEEKDTNVNHDSDQKTAKDG
eukprot:g2332.t1